MYLYCPSPATAKAFAASMTDQAIADAHTRRVAHDLREAHRAANRRTARRQHKAVALGAVTTVLVMGLFSSAQLDAGAAKQTPVHHIGGATVYGPPDSAMSATRFP